MKNPWISRSVFIAMLLVLYLFFNGTAPIDDILIKPVTIPEKLDFCNELVPLDDEEVKERVDKELLGNAFWQSSNLMHLKKMTRYFPIIETILKENHIPDDIKFLAVAESGLSGVVSPVGAAGFWQFMPATGRQYGLEINDEIDERYDIEKSTEAACRYLKDMNELFGSWTLSAAAYNCGVSAIKRSLEFQKVNNYYDLFLNTETSRYVFRIIALKEILSHPEKYRYQFSKNQGYKPYKIKSINISGPVANWSDWAINHGINYKILRTYNPWIRKHLLSNKSGKTFMVQVPLDLKNIQIDEKYIEQLEQKSEDTSSKLSKVEDNGKFKEYIVKSGETLIEVASKLDISEADLIRWNSITNKPLKSGQKLKYIPSVSE